MTAEALEILEPGLLTTVQDVGRFGYQRFGVPESGAMDWFALKAANLLVGNEKSAAGLEMTVVGPRIRFLSDTWIAIAGADLEPQLDGQPIAAWQSLRAPEGATLSFGGARDGVRAYLAVYGGIDVPVVMGSRSTNLKGAFGGLDGRAIVTGDILATLPHPPGREPTEARLPEHLTAPSYGHRHDLRVVLGPQQDAFAQKAIDTLLSATYTVSLESDRMGCRLEGPMLEHRSTADIVSEGIALGAVQVPGDGQPIVLLADRGTTGGYAKIATVISADVGGLAQAMPGDTVSFAAISVEEAHAALREKESILRDIGRAGAAVRLSISVAGQAFEAMDESGQLLATSEHVGHADGAATHRARATVGDQTYEFDVTVREVD